MKALLTLLLATATFNAAAGDRLLETQDEARERQQSERYEAKKARGGDEPLGGYTERLGDPAPRNSYEPPSRNNPGTWQDKAKR
jgi:hypothetical protein